MNNSQLSLLVDFGMRPDATDEEAAKFARMLGDSERAALEQLGDDNFNRLGSASGDLGDHNVQPVVSEPQQRPVDPYILNQVRQEVTRSNQQTAASRIAIHSRSHEGDCTLAALQGGMLLRHGFTLDDEMFGRGEAAAMLRRDGVRGSWLNDINRGRSAAGAERDRDNAHRYGAMSLVDFCREALRLSARSIPVDQDDMIRRALSTAALSAVFSTSINMQILQAYLGLEDSTRGWCSEADVDNFKQNDRGRLTKASGMGKLARGGEAQQINFGDAVESYKIARYAGQFTLDEQDIIDDTLGGLSEHTPRELAAELRPNLVYAILLANANMRDGKALFHADHGNLEASAALAALTLKTVKANMALQTENGRQIANAMRYLIVPENLEFTASQLVNSVELRNQSTSSHDGTANPHRGQFEVRHDPRLDNGVTDPDTGETYTGSETTWFGASGRHGIEVG